MRTGARTIRGYAKPKGAVLAGSLAAFAAAGVAHAEDAPVLAASAAATAEVDPVVVTGRRPLGEDTGIAALPTTVQDTPQAINVIPGEQLRTQGVATLEQALRNVPGITIAIGEGGQLNGDQFKIRGFDSKDDVYVDGLRDFGAYTRDSFNFQEVQVLKGPSGAMFGRGTTGGVINTVSKRPRLEEFTSVDLYGGTGDYYRALVDVNRRLGATTAARLNLMASSTGVVDRDLIQSDRWGAALAVGFGLGTKTQVTATLLHQYDRRRPDYGIIIVQRPGEIVARPATEYGVGVERSTFTGFRNDRDRSTADILTVRVSHEATDKLTLTSDTRYGAYSRYFQYSTLDQCNAACTTALFDNSPATEPQGGIGGSSPYDMDAWGLQNISTARYDANLGSLRNQAILGIDVSRQVNDKLFYAYTLPVGIATRPAMPHPFVNPNPDFPAGYGVFRAIPGANINCAGSGNCRTTVNGATVFTNVAGTASYDTRGESTSLAAFLTDRLWLTPQISVIGSLRIDRYQAEFSNLTFAGVASTIKSKSTLKSPRVSLVYEPAEDQTFYASWGRTQTPQGTSVVNAGTALTPTAKDLEPETSEIIEAGAKFRVPGTGVAATLSVFKVQKDNALQVDSATGFLLAQSGEKQSVRGLEVGLTGRLSDAWTLSGGYSYLDSKIEESFSNCAVPTSTAGTPTNIVCPVGVTAALPVANTVAVGRQVTSVPKHAASLYTQYDASRWVEGLSFGGDVSYQSKLFLTYQARSASFADRGTLVANRIAEVPQAVTVNANLTYRTGAYRLALNVYNLTDALNYTQVFSNRAIPTAGRTVIVSVGASF